jgi:hypothetical protein
VQSVITPILDMQSSKTAPIGPRLESVHSGVPAEAFGQVLFWPILRSLVWSCSRNRLLTPPRTAYCAKHPEQAELYPAGDNAPVSLRDSVAYDGAVTDEIEKHRLLTLSK